MALGRALLAMTQEESLESVQACYRALSYHREASRSRANPCSSEL